MASDIIKILLEACPEAYRRAFETAVRTETALIQMSEDGTVEHYYPPFRYVMVPKEPTSTAPTPQKPLSD